jgi:prepilin-type N-terminal cleavage/methylation domain-containing protein
MEGGKGFTLLELVIVLCILGILVAVAFPKIGYWRKESQYREAARDLASAMREARSRAITTNRQYRVEVDLDSCRSRIVHGNRPIRSTPSSWDHNVVSDWVSVPAGELRANSDCNSTSGIVSITFNSLGSSNSRYLCIMDNSGQRRFRVGVGYTSTGKVTVTRWDEVENSWE